MIICTTVTALKKECFKAGLAQKTCGFVPTMGALHEGHLSLIELSKQQSDITICSIFVNPTQFNDAKDFEKYPITIENDILILEKSGCDILFLPNVQEIYPTGTSNAKHYDLGFLETVLEGSFRSGHFQGVCQVVERLLDIVEPNKLYLGQKDYQQCMVITKLVELMGLKEKIQVIIGETLREQSGLAMSSRNKRLNNEELEKATAIYKALVYIKQHASSAPINHLKQESTFQLTAAGFEKIDYIEIVNAQTLEPILEWDESIKSVALIAAFLNGVRLIDNLILN